MGYSPQQLADLAATIAAVPCDAVLVATPIDLARLIDMGHPAVRVTYEVVDRGMPTLRGVIESFLRDRELG
jgi:predicted GTPase